jgi:hypothetical protein
MNGAATRLVVIVSALAFTLFLTQPPRSYASYATPDVEVTVKVTEKGFLDSENRPLGPRNPLKVRKGQIVKVTFEFSESVNSLAIGDTHQVAIISEDGWEKETGKIWIFNQKTSVTFRAGENDRARYRVYCILDCIGMEYLNNMVIQVV